MYHTATNLFLLPSLFPYDSGLLFKWSIIVTGQLARTETIHEQLTPKLVTIQVFFPVFDSPLIPIESNSD